MRYFYEYNLTDVGGKLTASEGGRFFGNVPRQAALKICRRGAKLILVREGKTKKVHVYTGSVSKKLMPSDDTVPAWIRGRTIDVPHLSKVGVIKFKKLSEILDKLPAEVEAMLGA